jgi:hypothetical protein
MRPTPAAAGMLIREAGLRELVEVNVHDLGYRGTPVLSELGGRHVKNPLARIFVGPVLILALPRPR